MWFVFSMSAQVEAHNVLKQVKATEIAKEYGCMIVNAVSEFGNAEASPTYILAQMLKESTGNPRAVNKESGAVGLMQIKPSTAAYIRMLWPKHYFGPNLFDPSTNIRLAVAYRLYIADRYKEGVVYDDPPEVSIGYHLGPKGGEQHVAHAYQHSYTNKIEDWGTYTPTILCTQ